MEEREEKGEAKMKCKEQRDTRKGRRRKSIEVVMQPTPIQYKISNLPSIVLTLFHAFLLICIIHA